MLKTLPAVFAVDRSYQIMVQVKSEALMYVKIGDKTYYDDSNGIMNSLYPIHRVCVPMEVLDREKAYTVCIRPVTTRKPYFTDTKKPVEFHFTFAPVPEKNIRMYHISDAHNAIDTPVKAAKTFGEIDLLILNGDVIDHSGDWKKFINIYEICARVTAGKVPVVFSRGNHDMRGKFAERFADYTPSHHQKTYYTFRLGSIWGVILDCGEDKLDENPEYGYTVACHGFRERQTAFLKDIIDNREKEYEAEGVKTRLVIVHNPFTHQFAPPFDIEEDIYRQWADLLNAYIKPDLMLCGHDHEYGIHKVGGEYDHLGQPCTLVVASEPRQERFIGCGFVVGDSGIEAVFTDSLGNTILKESIPKAGT